MSDPLSQDFIKIDKITFLKNMSSKVERKLLDLQIMQIANQAKTL
jgi:hypothetical protein